MLSLALQRRPLVNLKTSFLGVPIWFTPIPRHQVETLSPEAILSRCIVDPSGSQLFSSNSLHLLTSTQCEQLLYQCKQGYLALPHPASIEGMQALETEARQGRHLTLLFQLGSCYQTQDYKTHTYQIDRPDLFYGLPPCDLLDCHWAAYQVARKLINEARDKNE